MTPPGGPVVPEPARLLQESGRTVAKPWMDDAPRRGFREAKNVSVRVLFDFNPVVYLIDAQDLGVAAVAPQLVVLAHDQRLDRLGGAHLGAQPAEAAARKIEVEVVENLDLL